MGKLRKSLILFLALALISIGAQATDIENVKELVPLGHTTGIKIFYDGVTVVDVVPVETDRGEMRPAQSAGITKGDVIKSIQGEGVHSNEQMKKLLEKCKGKNVTVTFTRGNKRMTAEISPVKDKDGEYKLGIMIRDSMAGIGTLTFYEPKTKMFGALGHGICDSENDVPVPFGSGMLMDSKVTDVKKGEPGNPGELVGEYDLTKDSGTINENSGAGIFGIMGANKLVEKGKAIPIGRKNEVKIGGATILSNISGDSIEEYSVEIIRVFPDDDKDTKNMMIHVTDKKLIEKTGGIVQGMSGSPIIQDGKLVGAVTHVLVNDPTRGYGIFIENMLDAAG